MITQDFKPTLIESTTAPDSQLTTRVNALPVNLYLESLNSENSRRAMATSLQKVAEFYAELFIIRPAMENGADIHEAIALAESANVLKVATIQREGARFGQPRLDPNGNVIYIGNPEGIDWSTMTYLRVEQIISAMRKKVDAKLPPDERLAARTVNHCLAAIRGVMDKARKLRMISSEDYLELKDIKPVRVSTVRTGRHIAIGEINDLKDAARNDENKNTAARNLALLHVFLLGLRISEIANLRREDLDTKQGKFTILGKGNKQRIEPIYPKALLIINEWLRIRGNHDGPLFPAIHKSGAIQPKGMTRQAITAVLNDLVERAGVDKLSPHDFRRTFAGNMLSLGCDISKLQKLMGHASVTTTGQYDHRSDAELFEAIKALDELYGG